MRCLVSSHVTFLATACRCGHSMAEEKPPDPEPMCLRRLDEYSDLQTEHASGIPGAGEPVSDRAGPARGREAHGKRMGRGEEVAAVVGAGAAYDAKLPSQQKRPALLSPSMLARPKSQFRVTGATSPSHSNSNFY